jgi:hypothetical protein
MLRLPTRRTGVAIASDGSMILALNLVDQDLTGCAEEIVVLLHDRMAPV